jgi:4-amino-4-deoxychorismate lyase
MHFLTTSMPTLVNGVLSDAFEVYDRGLHYGDGVFRTLIVKQGIPIWWQDHYRKLEADCHALGIMPPDEPTLASDIRCLSETPEKNVIKIIVTRGTGDRGFAAQECMAACRIVSLFPMPDLSPEYAAAGVKVRICELRLGHQPRLAGIKHLNRLENVLARMEWSDHAIAEGLLLDGDGNVIEGVTSNLFMVLGDHIVTPGLSRCGVAGVARERLIRAARTHDVDVEIREIQTDEMQQADALYLTNSVTGIRRIRQIESWSWVPGPDRYPLGTWLDEA